MKILLTIFLQLFISISAIALPGDSCVPLPITVQSEIATFIQSKLEATDDRSIPDSKRCDDIDGTITICVLNQTKEATNILPSCDLITFSLGQEKTIFNTVAGKNSFVTNVPNSIIATKLKAVEYQKLLCLNAATEKGSVPLVCKRKDSVAEDQTIMQNCKIDASCYDKSENKGKVSWGFMGKAYQCTKQSLDKIFYSAELCVSSDEPEISEVNPFSSFQLAMRRAILASLVIYIMFFGFRVLLNQERTSAEDFIWAVIKVVLVIYFSIGMGEVISIGGSGSQFNDGITQIVLPMLLNASYSFADIVFSSVSKTGLCYFDPKTYDSGYGYYALWDSIDCRWLYYLSGEMLRFADSVNQMKPLAIFQYIIYFIVGGHIILVILLVMFSIYFISMTLSFLSSTIINMICLYFLAYLAPIFVPFSLFSQTKSFFDNWTRLMLSFAIRPAVYAGFIAMCVTVVDQSLYSNCEFIEKGSGSSKVFELKLPSIEPEKCKNSPGYILSYIVPKSIVKKDFFLFSQRYIKHTNNTYKLLSGMLLVAVILFIFAQFALFVSDFAADITGGGEISTSAMEINPNAFMQKAMQAASKAGSAGKNMFSKAKNLFSKKKDSGAKDNVMGKK